MELLGERMDFLVNAFLKRLQKKLVLPDLLLNVVLIRSFRRLLLERTHLGVVILPLGLVLNRTDRRFLLRVERLLASVAATKDVEVTKRVVIHLTLN